MRFCTNWIFLICKKSKKTSTIFLIFLYGTLERDEILIIFIFLKFLEIFFEVKIFGQKSVFRTLGRNFRSKFLLFSGNFAVLGRGEGVFYPSVKKESKSASIRPKIECSKIAKFFASFPIRKRGQLVSIITFRYRHGLGPKFNQISISVRR